MKWMINRLFNSSTTNEWKIKIINYENYMLIEITDPVSRMGDIPSIYLKILDLVLKDCQAIELSQFIDETQGMLDDKAQVLSELSINYGLQIASSKEYSTGLQPTCDCSTYVLNVMGLPDYGWLSKVMAFGGASLSNIVYGLEKTEKDWLCRIVERNQIFTKWYRLEIGKADLLRLRHEVKKLCWTSDSHLNILVIDSEVIKIMIDLEKISDEYLLNMKVDQISG